MADYYQLKNQNIFNPPANTDMGNANSQFNTMYVQNALVLGNVSVTGTTIIAPRVTSIAYPGNDTAADTAGGQTITLNGTGFVAGASVLINGSAVGVVSVASSTVITFTSPANTTGSYVIYVVNPDGSTAIAIPGIQYSGTPTWTTAAGTLGNVYETASFTQTVTATGDAPITYSVASGSLPPGSTFNANGTITGTSQLSSSPTTYSFTVRATDAEQQDTDRAFSIAVIPDVVTWSNPTDNTTYSPAANIAIANITLSATSAVGSGITYTANTLPTGLSLTGANISGTPTVAANTSTLLTATANTTSELSSITINWSVSVASDPYFMYNSLLLPGTGTNGAQNNTFLDGSTNNFTITRAGNTTQGTFSPYGPNWSTAFTASSGDYLSVPYSSAFNLTGDFTVECWFNPSLLPTSAGVGTPLYPRIFSFGTYNAANSLGLEINSDGSVSKAIGVWYNGSPYFSANNIVTVGQWYHCAVVRSGTTITVYLNGTSIITINSASAAVNTSQAFFIGSLQGFTTTAEACFKGYISNLRVVKGTAVYTGTFTPSTTPLTAITNTTLLTCQSNRFIDNSTTAATITSFGTTSIQRFSPFSPTQAYSAGTIGGSGYFDGTGDYLTAAQNAAFNFGTGAFTVEAWVYLTAYPSGGNSSIFSLGDGATGPSGPYSGWALTFGSTGINFYRYDGTETNNSVATPIPLNTWSHVVVVRSSSNLSIYLNGARILNNASSTTSYNNVNSNNLNIGYWNSGASPVVRVLTGYYSDGRIVKGTAVYDPTLTTLTVPTAPLTAVANTSLLLNYTNAGIIDNTMLNNLETVGNAQISTAQTKFGSGSMYFDGASYLSLPSSDVRKFGTGNFTFEFWIYTPSNIPSFTKLVTGGSGGSTFTIETQGTTNVLWVTTFDATLLQSTVALTNSTWTHFAAVRNSGTLTIYINGVASGSTSNSTNFGSYLYIGGRPSTQYFTGYMDDIRATKGYARYTTTFTPPTSAFPTY